MLIPGQVRFLQGLLNDRPAQLNDSAVALLMAEHFNVGRRDGRQLLFKPLSGQKRDGAARCSRCSF